MPEYTLNTCKTFKGSGGESPPVSRRAEAACVAFVGRVGEWCGLRWGASEGDTLTPHKWFVVDLPDTLSDSPAMPSPKFTFRLPAKDKASMLEVSKLFGAVSPGAFCAEMIGAVCSGDMERIKAFNAKLIRGMGEQLTLKLNSAMDVAFEAEKPAKKGRKPSKTGKGVRRAS